MGVHGSLAARPARDFFTPPRLSKTFDGAKRFSQSQKDHSPCGNGVSRDSKFWIIRQKICKANFLPKHVSEKFLAGMGNVPQLEVLIMRITSRSNPTVVAAAGLKEKKYRDESRSFLLEGVKLFREAVASGLVMERVFATERMVSLCRELLPAGEILTVSDSVLEKISTEKSPQGVISVAKYLDKIHIINKIYKEEDFQKAEKRILILSSLRDPGNLGTVIRSATAFGADELILSADCADFYHPRTVRAAMGTLFRQKITVVKDLPETVRVMTAGGYRVCAAVLDDKAERLDAMTINRKTAFVVGNEGHGIDPAVVQAAGHTVYIPMSEGVESLNAAAAATVFLWQSRMALHADSKKGE